jgi:hypothetical protein
VDRLLASLEEPQVLGTAAVLGIGLAIYAALTVKLSGECQAARSDCGQVLSLVHRIPGVGGAARPEFYGGGYLF